MGAAWTSVGMQAWREIIRFVRQRSRVTGAALQPLLFWLLFGLGLQGSFRPGGAKAVEAGAADGAVSYLEFFFPGTVVLVLLFTAIFATISIIEDRREGFLQSVLVSPSSRWQMVLGKISGGAAIAVVQAALVVVVGMVSLSSSMPWIRLPILGVMLTLGALSLTSLGFVIAWRMESTSGFHAIMNLFLMPMWLLSGAFFPAPILNASSTPSDVVIHWIIRLNPLTYCVSGVRRLMSTATDWPGIWTPSLSACWLVSVAFAAVLFAAACRVARVRIGGDLL